MADFLEERLPVGVRMGASYGDEYVVEITENSAGAEFRRLVTPFPKRRWVVEYTQTTSALWDSLVALYHRAYGTYAGFRVNCLDDNSTNGRTGAPTATDQILGLVSTGVYQLQKEYGAGATPLGIGRPRRTLYKPVVGSALFSIANVAIQSSDWTLDATTGRITHAANITGTITAISKAIQAVITVGAHAFATGMAVCITGVSGMAEINGQRATITAISGTTITIAINSTAYGTYTSGGAVNTRPQTGEIVRGGCHFDIPARFNSHLDIQHIGADIRQAGSIDIVELLNP